MKPEEKRLLAQLARHYGIQTSYKDAQGRRQMASSKTLGAILEAMGVQPETVRLKEQLDQARLLEWNEMLEPVCLAWQKENNHFRLRLPGASPSGRLECLIQLENGGERKWQVRLDRLAPVRKGRLDRKEFQAWAVPLPGKLPLGYHTLEARAGAREARSMLISAPPSAFAEPLEKRWGLFVPLYALHSKRAWGAGDYTSLHELFEWMRENGGSVAATLPLLPAFLDRPFEPSPYSPVSRLFWNEFYLDIERLPELEHCQPARNLLAAEDFQKILQRSRKNPLVDYAAVWKAKRRALELLAADFFSGTHSPSARHRNNPRPTSKMARLSALREALKNNPGLENYARFRAAMEKTQKPWNQWPERLRQGNLEEGDYLESTRQFFLYAQWNAGLQMAEASRAIREKGGRLYLDLPLGVHPDGYDVWKERRAFVLEASGGAPPDAVFTQGQDWGFAPLHPQEIRRQHYKHFLDYLRHHFSQAGILRIDHVMGLHRLFWVPKGAAPREGAYVSYPADELYAILSLESHRHGAMVVGENLGTVPPEVNRMMQRRQVGELFVGEYEFKPGSRRVLRPAPRDCIASLNTHDMPPFQAYWLGHDVDDLVDLGLYSPRQGREKKKEREIFRRAWIRLLQKQGLLDQRETPPFQAVLRASLDFFNRSPARVHLVNLEDLWGETQPQNVPGTTNERINWRRKIKFRMEQLRQMTDLLSKLNGSRARKEK
jgi:4-alpha-glucanotransferase